MVPSAELIKYLECGEQIHTFDVKSVLREYRVFL